MQDQIRVQVNGEECRVSTAADLEEVFSRVRRLPFVELWLTRPNGEALCALTNGDCGWLMHLPAAGDPGFSSRNPGYDGEPNAALSFQLSNGQVDEYPASWTLPLGELFAAIGYFCWSGGRTPSVAWHDAS
jgi:hypothetical protein